MGGAETSQSGAVEVYGASVLRQGYRRGLGGRGGGELGRVGPVRAPGLERDLPQTVSGMSVAVRRAEEVGRKGASVSGGLRSRRPRRAPLVEPSWTRGFPKWTAG